ncbi:MAG: C4-dicarboxylate ABC transporter [Prevotella sp.]|nr:C4-dicarboxylate ABC transporter [Prevotella sp.]
MSKGKRVDDLLQPLAECPIQAYFGMGLHTLGLLQWILKQTGKATVFVSSYSTSEPFLNGFYLLREKDKVEKALLLLDQRAARKTLQLEQLMTGAFEHVFLGQNHSKVLLVHNARWQVSVVTSQNQTYGQRAESTIVTTNRQVYEQLMAQMEDSIVHRAVEIDVEHGTGIIAESRGTGQPAADAPADWQPIGVEW